MDNEERIRETFKFINDTSVSEIEEITVEYLINRVGLLAPRFKIGDMVYDPFYGDDNRIQALEVIEINYNGESFTYACADRAMYFDQRDATTHSESALCGSYEEALAIRRAEEAEIMLEQTKDEKAAIQCQCDIYEKLLKKHGIIEEG